MRHLFGRSDVQYQNMCFLCFFYILCLCGGYSVDLTWCLTLNPSLGLQPYLLRRYLDPPNPLQSHLLKRYDWSTVARGNSDFDPCSCLYGLGGRPLHGRRWMCRFRMPSGGAFAIRWTKSRGSDWYVTNASRTAHVVWREGLRGRISVRQDQALC